MTLEFLLVCVACALTLNVCVPLFEEQSQALSLVRVLDGYARAALIGAAQGEASRYAEAELVQARASDPRLAALNVSSVCVTSPNCLSVGGLLRIDGDLGRVRESVFIEMPAR